MYHITLRATSGQMVFGRDMILNTPFITEWEAIRIRMKIIIHKNNQIENRYGKLHIYRIQNKVLARNKKENKYEYTYIGPYPITQVWTSGKVTICQGSVQYCIKIRWIKPYHK